MIKGNNTPLLKAENKVTVEKNIYSMRERYSEYTK